MLGFRVQGSGLLGFQAFRQEGLGFGLLGFGSILRTLHGEEPSGIAVRPETNLNTSRNAPGHVLKRTLLGFERPT